MLAGETVDAEEIRSQLEAKAPEADDDPQPEMTPAVAEEVIKTTINGETIRVAVDKDAAKKVFDAWRDISAQKASTWPAMDAPCLAALRLLRR